MVRPKTLEIPLSCRFFISPDGEATPTGGTPVGGSPLPQENKNAAKSPLESYRVYTSLEKSENPRNPPVLSVFYSGGTPE